MNSKFRFLLPICLGICCLMAVMDLSAKGVADLNEKIKDYEYVGDFSEGLAVVKKEGKIGFVDKSGELVIPLKWSNDDSRLDDIKFHNGRCVIPETKNTKAYLIDKKGNELCSGISITATDFNGDWNVVRNKSIMYVYHEEGGHSVYFLGKESIQKIDQLENDKVLVALNIDYNTPGVENGYNNYAFTLENLCGEVVGVEKLEEKYGYQYVPSVNCSHDGVGLAMLLNKKTNKYGIVDQKGNVVVPFQYDNKIVLYYGLLLEIICFRLETDMGERLFPIYCNVYKDGHLLYEKLPFFLVDLAQSGMFVFDATSIADWCEKLEITENDFPFPASIEKSKMIDESGKEVSRFRLGKNYLRRVEGNVWQLEDEGGNLVYPNRFSLPSRYRNGVRMEDSKTYEQLYLADDGNTIDGSFTEYVVAGLVKMTDKFPQGTYPLCYYKSNLSEEDNRLNCHYTKIGDWDNPINVRQPNGSKLLPYDVDEVSYFSDGLLRLRVGKRYFFVDKKGEGIEKR